MLFLPKDTWVIKTMPKTGRGIFTKKDIAPGTVIGDYIGKVIKTAEEDIYETDDGLYLMYYHAFASLYPMDIKAPGIHLFNHSCNPNCWMYTYKGHTLFFALRHIFAGEELTVSYQLAPVEPGEAHDPNYDCHCNTRNCKKTMHLSQKEYDKWYDFNAILEKKTKRAPITYGKELPLLSSYPETIEDDKIYHLSGNESKPPIILDTKIMPSVLEIRKIIRETGKTLELPKLKLRIFGTQEKAITTEKI